jgi:hypothetical protein
MRTPLANFMPNQKAHHRARTALQWAQILRSETRARSPAAPLETRGALTVERLAQCLLSALPTSKFAFNQASENHR